MSTRSLTNAPPLPTPSASSTFAELDASYRYAVEAPGRELATALTAALSKPNVDLNSDDLTRAILLRMKSFATAQDLTKIILRKGTAAAASDFFVESVCFFLKVALANLAPSLQVKSETTLEKKRGSLRPDISVWQSDSLVAVIECKTSLHWNRGNWLTDFDDRRAAIAVSHGQAKIFLLVLGGAGLPGLERLDPRFGRDFIVLQDFAQEQANAPCGYAILHPIERLFEAVLLRAS